MTSPTTGGTSTSGGQPHPESPPTSDLSSSSLGGDSGTDGGQPHPEGEPTA